jgi:enediyne biosynthesis protein E4
VYVTANGMRQRSDVFSGASYLSSSDMRLHFGLGDATRVDSIEIHWPSGAVEKLKPAGVDRIFSIEEGKGVTGELCRTCSQK